MNIRGSFDELDNGKDKNKICEIKTFIYKVYFKYTMSQITTIKLRKSTKSELDSLKNKVETYDVAIKRLISSTKNKNLKFELIEAYSQMGKKDLELLEDWDQSSNELEDNA